MLVRAEDVTYSSEGATVPARLFRAEGAREPCPGVLLCPGRLREIDGLTFLADALVAQGIVVLATAYRGMPMQTDDQDCVDGLSHLGALPGVDASRLGLVGHSRGAMASLRTAARDDRVRSVVALQPVADMLTYTVHTRDYAPTRYQALIRGIGSPEEAPDAYRALSAIHTVDRVRVPVLLVAGTQDLHSPVDESVALRDRLLAAGNADVRLEVLDGVGHFFERMYSGYAHADVARLVTDHLARTLLAAPASA